MSGPVKEKNQWCPGCPNNLIRKALADAIKTLGLPPEKLCLVSGIGQAAKMPHYLPCNFFNGLHGRALPVALGIAAANPNLALLVTTGDGDCYGEGGNHFIHTLRRNPDITLIVHNNSHYALTKGQASPTTEQGETRDLHPRGVSEIPLNPLGIAMLHGCGFVARGSALEPAHLASLIVEGIKHQGLSLIDIMQPCITWDKHPLSWHRARTYILEEGRDRTDLARALDLTVPSRKIPLGILYKRAPAETFGEKYRALTRSLPLAALPLPDQGEMAAALRPFLISGRELDSPPPKG